MSYPDHGMNPYHQQGGLMQSQHDGTPQDMSQHGQYQPSPMTQDPFSGPHKQTPPAAAQQYEIVRPRSSNSDEQLPKPSPVPTSRGWRFYGSITCLAVFNFIIALDGTIIAVPLPNIAVDLNATAVQAFWCGTAFLLAQTAIQPLFTSWSHIFGRLPLTMAGLTIFTVGSIIAAVAKNIGTLLGGRVVQGIGAGGMLSLSYVIMTDLVTLRERGKWFGFMSLAASVGSILGPIIGGAFAEHNWRWIFWINLPICGLCYVACPLCLRLRKKGGGLDTKLRQFDWFGSAIFTGGLISFLIPLSWGGIQYEWSSVQTIVPLVIGILTLIGFGLHVAAVSMYSSVDPLTLNNKGFLPRFYSSLDPLLRPSLFMQVSSVTAYVSTLLHGIMVWSAMYYVPLYVEVGLGFTPLMSGVAMLPWMAVVAPSATVVGLVINKRGKYASLIWVGWVFATAGFGMLMLLRRDMPTYQWVLLFLVPGIGLGMLYSAQSFACQAFASNADLPFAAGISVFFRTLGQTMGVAIGGVAFQNAFRKRIEDTQYASHADGWSKDASALVVFIDQLGDTRRALKDVLVDNYVEALRTVWLMACVLGAVALVATLLGVRDTSLDRELDTDQGLVEGLSSRRAGAQPSDVTLTSASATASAAALTGPRGQEYDYEAQWKAGYSMDALPAGGAPNPQPGYYPSQHDAMGGYGLAADTAYHGYAAAPEPTAVPHGVTRQHEGHEYHG